MSDLDLFANSEEERDRRGCYERPITYRDYVGLSKSSSLLKRNRRRERRPLVLQTSCSSEEDELPPSSRPRTDQRRNRTDDHHTPRRVLHKEKVLAPLTDVTNKNPSKSAMSVKGSSNKESGSAYTQSLAGIEMALLETNKLLRGVLNRVDKCEKQIKSFESKLNDTASSSTSTSVGCTPSRKKAQVPEEVRHETRRVYYMLLDEDETFDGWNCSPSVTFKDRENQKVVNKLVTEVKGLNDHFISQHIRDAAYRFYRSHREEESLKRRGKNDDKQRRKRRHERQLRKLEERIATLSKVKFADTKDKGKWEKVLILELMSSEDSGTDDDDDILVVRPLPWRSSKVDQMFKELDKETLSGKSPRYRHQMKQRKTGSPSNRPQCTLDGVPRWAFSS